MAQELQDPWALQALALAQQGQGKTADAIKSYEALASVPGAGPHLHRVGPGRRRALRGPLRRRRVALRRRRQGRPGRKGRRSRRRQVRRAGLHRAGPRPPSAGPSRRRSGAGQQHRHADSLSGRPHLRADRGGGAGARHRRQARCRTAGRAAGLRQDHRGRRRARAEGRPRWRSRSLSEATTLLDTWIGRFDLGRAYLAAGAYPQADSEFDRCLKRSGEARVAVPRRGADLWLPAAGLLLPGPGARRA